MNEYPGCELTPYDQYGQVPAPGSLPYVEIHGEGDVDVAEPTPYDEPACTGDIGVAEDLGEPAEPLRAAAAGRMAVPTAADDPRRRQVTVRITETDREDPDDTARAADPGTGVAEQARPKLLSQMSRDELDAIPVRHYTQLIEAFGAAAEAQAEPEGHDTIQYDPDAGFTVPTAPSAEPDGIRSPDEMAQAFINSQLSSREDHQPGDDLPPIGENFYAAYVHAFGAEAGRTLQAKLFEHGWNAPSVPELTNTVAVPRDIGSLLDEATPATEVYRGGTPKLTVRDHPELLARHEPTTPYHTVIAAKQAADALIDYGVKVLPSRPVEHDGDTYIITQRVDGISLEEAITDHMTSALLNQIDRTMAGLADALADAFQAEGRFPTDIIGIEQYMVGAIPYDSRVDVRMVDMPSSTYRAREFAEYERELFDITRTVVRIEQLIGMELHGAHVAIENALSNNRIFDVFGDAFTNATRHMLDTGELIDPGDMRRIMSFLRRFRSQR